MSDDNKQVWIGLVDIVPNEGNEELGDAKGAYVNILAFAKNENEYKSLIKFAAYEHNYTIQETKDIEPFISRVETYEVDQHLLELSNKVMETENTFFGEFFLY